jgi:histidinol-phosphatase (PHP family)
VSQFLETVKAHDVAIELNTAGLRKECREIYPSRHYLEMAHEIGVAITFGSDAHAPNEVGADFDQAIELAKSVGYRSTRVFTQRSYELVEI